MYDGEVLSKQVYEYATELIQCIHNGDAAMGNDIDDSLAIGEASLQ